MNTPRYVVRKIGSEYRIVRCDPTGVISSSLLLLSGTGLAMLGLARIRGLFSWAAVAAGAGVIFYAITGENPIDTIREKLSANPLRHSRGPSHQHADSSQADQRAEDGVDEASMESFPASDPPARTRATATNR